MSHAELAERSGPEPGIRAAWETVVEPRRWGRAVVAVVALAGRLVGT